MQKFARQKRRRNLTMKITAKDTKDDYEPIHVVKTIKQMLESKDYVKTTLDINGKETELVNDAGSAFTILAKFQLKSR